METAQEKPTGRVDRRHFLSASAAVSATMFVSGTALIHPGEAWGLETKGLKPETMKTLVKIARDIYPHDRLPDKFYAIAVKSYDEKAAADQSARSSMEESIAKIDELAKSQHKLAYADIGLEQQRVAILRKVEGTPFFQTIRGGLIVGLYNQRDIWPYFGYEGESASHGGYIQRGFNDLAWL